jgi:hypothetical protein
LKARRSFARTVVFVICIAGLVFLRRFILPIVLPLMFTVYLLYGFIRPRISRKVRHEIEEEEDEDGSAPPT